jgi:hypothetical protein
MTAGRPRRSTRRKLKRTWGGPALALAVLAAAALAAAPAGAITNGQPTGPLLYPSVGALVVPDDIGELPWIMGPEGNFCSGTLVAPQVVLTAGHCTEGARSVGIGPDDVRVTFDHEIGPGSTFYSGTYSTHPLFGLPGWGGSMANPYDVAVIVLDEAPEVEPALLPPVGLLDALGPQALRHRSFTPVGYGTLRTSKKGGPHAFEPNSVRHYGTQGFWALQPAWLLLSMQPATGNSGTCYADSGGPHFLGATNTIVSITVTGDAMCRATDMTYRLDLPLVQDFLSGFGVPIPSS